VESLCTAAIHKLRSTQDCFDVCSSLGLATRSEKKHDIIQARNCCSLTNHWRLGTRKGPAVDTPNLTECKRNSSRTIGTAMQPGTVQTILASDSTFSSRPWRVINACIIIRVFNTVMLGSVCWSRETATLSVARFSAIAKLLVVVVIVTSRQSDWGPACVDTACYFKACE